MTEGKRQTEIDRERETERRTETRRERHEGGERQRGGKRERERGIESDLTCFRFHNLLSTVTVKKPNFLLDNFYRSIAIRHLPLIGDVISIYRYI